MAKPNIRVVDSEDELVSFLGSIIEKRANEAIKNNQRFTIAVSGEFLNSGVVIQNLKNGSI